MSLQKGFFKTQSSNPILPPEEWTFVQEITTAGSYSTSLNWGKYKIVFSGAGGGGAAAGWNEASGTRYAHEGSNGEELTVFLDVNHGMTKTVTGIIGAGGGGAAARARHSNYNYAGSGGAGYQNGNNGTIQNKLVLDVADAVTAGGGGGGSTSLEIDSVLNSVAHGGNGGDARQSKYSIWGYGGTGGSGGTISGTGATGGSGAQAYGNSQLYGDAGSDGYVRIYKSNLKPEPL